MVLAAGVEAAARLDAQPTECVVGPAVQVAHVVRQLCHEAPRGGDAQLAGIRARAGCEVRDGLGARRGQVGGFQGRVQTWQVSVAHPSAATMFCSTVIRTVSPP